MAVWGAQVALLPTQKIYGGPGTSWDWLARFGGAAAAASTGPPMHAGAGCRVVID